MSSVSSARPKRQDVSAKAIMGLFLYCVKFMVAIDQWRNDCPTWLWLIVRHVWFGFQPLSRKVPENPKFKHVRPTIDTGKNLIYCHLFVEPVCLRIRNVCACVGSGVGGLVWVCMCVCVDACELLCKCVTVCMHIIRHTEICLLL